MSVVVIFGLMEEEILDAFGVLKIVGVVFEGGGIVVLLVFTGGGG